MDPHADAPVTRARRAVLRRVALGSAIAAAALILAGVAAVWIALASLDTAPMRGWIRDGIRRATGLDVSWERLDVSARGAIRMDGLRIANPAPWSAHEPDLLAARRIEIDVAPAPLLGGRIRVSRLALHDLRATRVAGPDGSNLDALSGPPDAAAAVDAPAEAPWTLAGPRGLDARVDALSVDGIGLASVSVDAAGAATRLAVDGLALRGALALAPDGGVTGSLRLEGPEAGVPVRRDAGEAPGSAPDARVRVDAAVEASAGRAALHLRADVAAQTLTDRLPASFPAVAIDASIAETPDGLHLDVQALDVLDGAVTGRLAAVAGGADGLIRLRDGALRVAVSGLPDALRALLPVRLADAASLDLAVRDLCLSTTPPFLRPGGALGLTGDLGDLAFEAGGRGVTLQAVRPRLSLVPGADATATLDGEVAADRLTWTRDGLPEGDLVAPTAALEGTLRTEGTSDVALVVGTRALDATAGAVRLALRDVALRFALPVGRAWPDRAEAALTIGDSRAWVGDRPLAIPASRLDATLDAIAWDGAAPARSTGTLGLAGRVGTWTLDADVVKDARGADVRLALDAPDLAALRPLVPPGARVVDWDRAGARVAVTGRLDLAQAPGAPVADGPDANVAPEANLAFRLALEDVAVVLEGHRVHLATATIAGDARGRGTPAALNATLALPAPSIDGRRAPFGLSGDLRVDLAPARPALTASVRSAPDAGPVRVDLETRWTRSDRTLHWKLDAAMRDLGPLARLLDTVFPELPDPAALADARLALEGSGRLAGVVARMAGATPVLHADALTRARGMAALAVRATIEGAGPTVREGRLFLDLDATTPNRRLRARATLPEASLPTKSGRFQVAGAALDVTMTASDLPARGLVAVDGSLEVDRVTRDGADLPWPVGDLTLALGARVDRLASLRVDRLAAANGRTDTHVEASAAVDLPDLPAGLGLRGGEGIDRVVGRQAIAVQGTLRQDLAKVPLDPGVFAGSGTVAVPFRLESGDWTVYRVDASVHSTDVSLSVPALPLEIANLNGRTPIAEVVAIGPDGSAALVDEGGSDAWSRVRFADQHPFLSGATDVSMTRLTAGPLTMGPVAGNLRVAGRSLRLDQMEAAWRGGRATGQLILDLIPGNIGVGFRGNVTGIQAGGDDEPLDANAALTASLGTLDVAGRLHLNRVGRGHVRDLLDAFDPYEENTAINRVRKWLVLGYPKSVEVEIRHNALSAGIALGGIASIVRIDPVRGVPVAPLLRRYVGPMLPKEGEP